MRAGGNAVEYVLWHFGKDGFTIDGRYPFNDEPNVVYNILQNYEADYYGDNYIIWKKRAESRRIGKETGDVLPAKFDEWIIKRRFLRAVCPRALKNSLWHLSCKLVQRMPPDVIAPHPSPATKLFDAIDKVPHIVPPKVALTETNQRCVS